MLEQIMIQISTEGPWLLAVGSILIAMLAYFRLKSNQLNRRGSELKNAIEALKAHYAAVDFVLNHPAPSKQLKCSLIDFSEAVTDLEFRRHLGRILRSGDMQQILADAENESIPLERKQLEKQHDDLKRAFETAVDSGVVALFLRSPDTAEYYASVTSAMAEDRRREMRFARNAARFTVEKRNRNKHHGGPTGPVPAVA